VNKLMAEGAIKEDPITARVAAISCGIYQGTPVLDLDYVEDSGADADANFVLIEGGKIAEAQATAEGAPYDEEGLLRLLRLARIGCDRIFAAQQKAVAG
jgi:ribonuclease PH